MTVSSTAISPLEVCDHHALVEVGPPSDRHPARAGPAETPAGQAREETAERPPAGWSEVTGGAAEVASGRSYLGWRCLMSAAF